MLARASDAVYANLHPGCEKASILEPLTGSYKYTEHAMFDPRDQTSRTCRAPNTTLVQTIEESSTDTYAALFVQRDSRSQCIQRIIVSFRGTMSGLNVRTDIDTHQVLYQNPCK